MALCSLQVQRHLCGEDIESPEGAATTPSHQQSQRVEGERGPRRGEGLMPVLAIHVGEDEAGQPAFPTDIVVLGGRGLRSRGSLTGWWGAAGQLRCPSTAPAFLARGTVCVCCHPHHREHRAGHHPPPVHICLHRSPAFQGEALPGQRPSPGQLEGRDESQPLLLYKRTPKS